jgi:hypothetical protein
MTLNNWSGIPLYSTCIQLHSARMHCHDSIVALLHCGAVYYCLSLHALRRAIQHVPYFLYTTYCCYTVTGCYASSSELASYCIKILTSQVNISLYTATRSDRISTATVSLYLQLSSSSEVTRAACTCVYVRDRA